MKNTNNMWTIWKISPQLVMKALYVTNDRKAPHPILLMVAGSFSEN